MNLMNKILLVVFGKQIYNICSNREIVNKTINNFGISFQNFNYFLKFLIINYLMLVFVVNFFYIFLFFFKLKINFFYDVNLLIKKIPLVKNIQNFIVANLLLHTE